MSFLCHSQNFEYFSLQKVNKMGTVKLQVIWNIQHLLNLFVGCHLGRLHNTARENKLEKADALTAN